MKNSTLKVLVIGAFFIFLVFVYLYQKNSENSEDFEETRRMITIPDYLPAKNKSDLPSKIPRKVVRCFATNQIDEIFKDSVDSVINLNPEYEHVFFTDEDCLQFMHTNFPGRITNAYESLVPGAYKSDLFRICYLYKYGGVYIDINKELLVPLKEIIDDKVDLFTVIDIPKCCVWQAFIACRPGLPFMKECIEQCVTNIESKYYGKSVLSVTGPGMVGDVYKKYYGVCVARPGSFILNGDNIKLASLGGIRKGFVRFKGTKILNLNREKRVSMDKHWKHQTSLPHYSELWNKRMIYVDEYPQSSIYN